MVLLYIVNELFAHQAAEVPGVAGIACIHESAELNGVLGRIGSLKNADFPFPELRGLADSSQFGAQFVHGYGVVGKQDGVAEDRALR